MIRGQIPIVTYRYKGRDVNKAGRPKPEYCITIPDADAGQMRLDAALSTVANYLGAKGVAEAMASNRAKPRRASTS